MRLCTVCSGEATKSNNGCTIKAKTHAMIGTIAGSFEKNQRDATEQLAKLYPTLKALHDEIVETLQEIMTGKKPLASKIA